MRVFNILLFVAFVSLGCGTDADTGEFDGSWSGSVLWKST